MEIRDTRNGEWHWVSNKILACNSIDVYDKAVYAALSTFAGCVEIRPSFEIIAKRCDVSIRKAKNSIKMLEKFGFVTIKNHGRKGVSNVYCLVKSVSGCQKCTVCLSKKGTVEQEVVHATTGSSAPCAPQLDKELDKELDNTSEARDISETIDAFRLINDNYKKMFGNTTERKVIKELISYYSKEEVLKLVYLAKFAITDQFFPNFITPYELQKKWNKVLKFYKIKLKDKKYIQEFEKFMFQIEKEKNQGIPQKTLTATIAGRMVNYQINSYGNA